MKTVQQDFGESPHPLAEVDADSPAAQVEPSQHHFWKKPLSYLGLILAGAGATIISLRLLPHLQTLPPALQLLNATASQPSANLAIDKNPNFIADVVKQVGSAVVRIDSTRKIKNPNADIFNNPTIQQFFGNQIHKRHPKKLNGVLVLVSLLILME